MRVAKRRPLRNRDDAFLVVHPEVSVCSIRKIHFIERIALVDFGSGSFGDGKLKSSAKEAAAAAGISMSAPKWQTTQYSVLLSRENNQWRIRNLAAIKVINEE